MVSIHRRLQVTSCHVPHALKPLSFSTTPMTCAASAARPGGACFAGVFSTEEKAAVRLAGAPFGLLELLGDELLGEVSK